MKNLFKAVFFGAILVLIIIFLNRLFSPVGTYEGGWYASWAMQDMYKQKENTIDVLYVGDSNIYAGVSPLEIYNKIGVTGFSASTPMQDIVGSYYIIKEFFKKQKPSVVMLESSEFFTPKENFSELGKSSEIYFMKFGKNKIDMINDKVYNFSKYEKLTYMLPVLKFHTRYSKLTEFDFRKLINKSEISYKGYLYDSNIKKMIKKKKNRQWNEEEELTTQNNPNLIIQEYVKNKVTLLKEFCKQNNSELVVLSMPTTDELAEEKYKVLKQYLQEQNIKYINYDFESQNQIDWTTDTQDGGWHLNIYGAEKVATYISNFITQNFEMENKKEKTEYNFWNENLKNYMIATGR